MFSHLIVAVVVVVVVVVVSVACLVFESACVVCGKVEIECRLGLVANASV